MKIAITAASGYLSTEIVKATVALLTKHNVIGLAWTPEKAKHLGIEIRSGDYNDKSPLEQSLKDIDPLLLVSGMDAPEKRITQYRNVIEAAKNAGIFQGIREGKFNNVSHYIGAAGRKHQSWQSYFTHIKND